MSARLTTLRRHLPRGAGLGLRPELWHDILERADEVDFVELIVDDHLGVSPREARRRLRPVLDALPVIAHGVCLSVGSVEGIDEDYVERVARLLDALQVEVYSEHLSFTRAGAHEVGQFVPLPFTEAWAQRVARNVERVQQITGRALVLENVTYLLSHPEQGVGEARFVAEVLTRADCGMLLDVTNLLINTANLGHDLAAYLEALPLDRVVLSHVAGGHVDGPFHIDSHGHPLPAEAPALLAAVAARSELGCALLERDKNYPPFDELRDELAAVRAALQRGAAARDDPASLPLVTLAPPPRDPELELAPPEPPPDPDGLPAAALQRMLTATLTTAGAWRALRDRDPQTPVQAYLLSFPPVRVRAFAKVLRYKRREKIEPLLPGLLRALGDALPDWLDRHFRHDPRQHLSRVDDALGLARLVIARCEAGSLVDSIARHEAAALTLRVTPWRPWWWGSQRHEERLHHDPTALDDFAHRGGVAPAALDAPCRVRYARRRRGVWVEVMA